jgi:hypothetical protein
MDRPERCSLCDQQAETINHLLVSCMFTGQVWTGLLQPVGLMELVPQPIDEVFNEWWRTSNLRVHGQHRKCFNSLVMLGAWVIWKHRNLCVFNGLTSSVPTAFQMAREEALLWTMAGAKGLSLLQAVGTPGA